MFETFNVPAMYIVVQGVLALYASGRTCGLVVDSGDSVTDIIPVYEGYQLPHAILKIDIGGKDITEFLMQLLTDRGYQFTTTTEKEVVRDAKEKFSFVSGNFEADMKASSMSRKFEKLYEFPSGNGFTLNNERFRCTEALFNPEMIGKNRPGLHKAIIDAVEQCEAKVHSKLYENIVLTGGNTMFEGVGDRITKEISRLIPTATNINVITPPERKYSVWIGGSILASLETFQQMWISKEEYDCDGPSIIHNKFDSSFSGEKNLMLN